MAYEVIARKWRPQLFGDMVGQTHVTETLKNAIKMNRIAHAYLFVGPRGIGKTSVARIFAKALNCVNGPTLEPCGVCDSCKEITSGTSLDVMEIDGASNNGVDQVRELRDTVKYLPGKGKYKIYIIDEVHMLSPAAFNALLKTLEEPPAHVKFIFATTEADKILPTIISRCQRFDLRRIPVTLIAERLNLIATDEAVQIDQDAILAIARGADGGLRDAESALDQLISFKGKTITEEDVLSVFGLVARATLEDLAGRILSSDIKGLIEIIGELDSAGKDFQRLMLELIEHFRNLLVWKYAGEKSGLELAEIQLATVKAQVEMADAERLLRVINTLAETEDRLRHVLSKRTLLETAMIRCARAVKVVSIEEILAELELLKSSGVKPADVRRPADPSARTAPVSGGASQVRESAPQRTVSTYAAPAPKQQPAPAAAPAPKFDAAADLKLISGKWGEIVDQIEKRAIGTRSALMDARAASVSETRVVIAMDPEFASERKTLETPRTKLVVEQVLTLLLKRKVNIEISMEAAAPKESEPVDSVVEEDGAPVDEVPAPLPEIAEQPPAPAAPAAHAAPAVKGRGRSELIKDPVVNKMMDLFNGTVIDVRE